MEGRPVSAEADHGLDVGRLAGLDTCIVSDALDALGLPAATAGISPVWHCGRVAGRAVTVALAPVGEGDAPPGRHLGTAAIAAAGPGDVIVVDNGGRTGGGGWGGLLGLAATQAKVGGVIIDGACRDVDEMEELGLPVFARAATARTTRRRFAEVDTNVDIAIDGVVVRPGDLVLADGSGVVVVPAERADEVLAQAERMAAEETVMADRLRAGAPATEVLGRRYETMMEEKGDNL